MGTIKDINGMDLTEAEDINKRWQEYTEELYQKDLHDPDTHDGVITHLEPDMITHLEPDILECEVKWAPNLTTNHSTTLLPGPKHQHLQQDGHSNPGCSSPCPSQGPRSPLQPEGCQGWPLLCKGQLHGLLCSVTAKTFARFYRALCALTAP